MTQEERLKIYNKALSEYKYYNLFIIKNFINTPFYMKKGFCHYFSYNFHCSLKDLVELYNKKPNNTYSDITGYWYEPGNLKLRIKLLKNAIKQIKNEIKYKFNIS